MVTGDRRCSRIGRRGPTGRQLSVTCGGDDTRGSTGQSRPGEGGVAGAPGVAEADGPGRGGWKALTTGTVGGTRGALGLLLRARRAVDSTARGEGRIAAIGEASQVGGRDPRRAGATGPGTERRRDRAAVTGAAAAAGVAATAATAPGVLGIGSGRGGTVRPGAGACRRGRSRPDCSVDGATGVVAPAGPASTVGRTTTATDRWAAGRAADGPNAATAAAAVGLLIAVRPATAAAEALAASCAPGAVLLDSELEVAPDVAPALPFPPCPPFPVQPAAPPPPPAPAMSSIVAQGLEAVP